jgi:HK97 family phage major capsid protein
VAFDSVKLEPKTVGAETEYSRRMIINASPDVENLMRRDLADTLATAIDWAVVAGDGQENRPTGVLHAPGTQALPYTDGDDVPEHLLQLEEALELSNVRGGQLAFLMHPSAYRAIRALKDADGHPLLMKARDRLHDLPVLRSSHIPRDEAEETSPLILGSWSDLMIGYWSTVDILVNPYHSAVYSKGAVKINALQDVDVAVRHPESFVIAADFIS